MTTYYSDCDIAVKNIIARVGKKIVIGVPLALGKPVGLLNALYRLASEDDSINLTILTGLTLSRPEINNDIEKRFLEPILERVLGDYEEPIYEKFRKKQQLPKNIKIIEFFLAPGKYLKNKTVQQDYINTNYTDAVRDVINHSINVIAQQVARSNTDPVSFSLSCNTDLFHETANYLNQFKNTGNPIAIVAEVNQNLPFMPGEAIVKAEEFTEIIDRKKYHSLFSIPKSHLSGQDHLIGLYSSTLVKDDGCLQIGIGRLGEAIANALIFRQKENKLYYDILKQLNLYEKFGDILNHTGSIETFENGLYSSTEMLSDGLMYLYNEKIINKKVYDNVDLQKLLNSKQITEKITPEFLDILIENNIIHSKLNQDDVIFLKNYGIIKSDVILKNEELIVDSGEKVLANLMDPIARKFIIDKCLGKKLINGKMIQAGFFLGSADFYYQLKNLQADELNNIEMTRISRTNSLCWSHELSELQRQHARFINAAMMITLEGGIISDGLKNWQEISGVGGQFDFAYMAQKLPQARFIINCHSTRNVKGKIHSNILWQYPNITLPRYLRDIIVTEYGIADCRSKTDSEIIKSILNITDSRFQNKLLKIAIKAGKLNSDYEIPLLFRNNYPESLYPLMKEIQFCQYFKAYPFGSELTDDEQVIAKALLCIKNFSLIELILTIFKSCLFFKKTSSYDKYLLRMQLDNSKTIKHFIYKKVLIYIIDRQKKNDEVEFYSK